MDLGLGLGLGRGRPGAVELVGIEHVGVSTDFSFDADDFRAEVAANPQLFDESYTRWGPIEWMPPETFLSIGVALERRRRWAGGRAVFGARVDHGRLPDLSYPRRTDPESHLTADEH